MAARKPAPEPDPTRLKRDGAGHYVSGDGRFTVEQASGRWLVLDADQQDDLGLPLVRGPFATLDEAREAAAAARSGPAPTSGLPARIAAMPAGKGSGGGKGRFAATGSIAPSIEPPTPKVVPVELRTYRLGDGESLRAFWRGIGFQSLGDDEDGLALFAARNPGLLLLATQGDRIVGSALGGWDGRRGWIYHVATAPDHRRAGLGRRLVHEVERRLRALGCPKVNVIVRDDAPDAPAFWEALGYAVNAARQFGREL